MNKFIPLDEIKISKIKYIHNSKRHLQLSGPGLFIDDKHYHPFHSMNLFLKEIKKIPAGYKQKAISHKHINSFYYDPKRKFLPKNNEFYKKIKEKNRGAKKYLTLDNGSRPYLVYVNKLDSFKYRVNIYKQNDKYYTIDMYSDCTYYYTKLAKSYLCNRVFISKTPINQCLCDKHINFSKYTGNTILLELPKLRYVFIETGIYEFAVKNKILKYFSYVGNNDVPYPYAIDHEYYYFMLDNVYVKRDLIDPVMKKYKKELNCDPYYFFYGYGNIPEELKLKPKDKKKYKTKKIDCAYTSRC